MLTDEQHAEAADVMAALVQSHDTWTHDLSTDAVIAARRWLRRHHPVAGPGGAPIGAPDVSVSVTR